MPKYYTRTENGVIIRASKPVEAKITSALEGLQLTKEREKKRIPDFYEIPLPGGTEGQYWHYRPHVLIDPKASTTTILHEAGHSILKHDKDPETPKEYIRDEVEANLFAYKRTKKPTHLIQYERGILNKTKEDFPKYKFSTLLKILLSELKRQKAPIYWIKEANSLKEEVRKADLEK